jgi:hypothetical protein
MAELSAARFKFFFTFSVYLLCLLAFVLSPFLFRLRVGYLKYAKLCLYIRKAAQGGGGDDIGTVDGMLLPGHVLSAPVKQLNRSRVCFDRD